ncbi:hypothetical protein CANCADRAFT_72609 [Tortispora caseinolytica NRRL Y-17796]|uniref:Uncharacterized protein n=1 Tax=Tortispora caseinolytica NRRL Y-17796 TaxID=767744 RepID=A0A1E4TIK4_9ASCO|nr:hypothetical protein CANCADRAFT_72609 [Tortispora caseinolytica NRRL Y-17796]
MHRFSFNEGIRGLSDLNKHISHDISDVESTYTDNFREPTQRPDSASPSCSTPLATNTEYQCNFTSPVSPLRIPISASTTTYSCAQNPPKSRSSGFVRSIRTAVSVSPGYGQPARSGRGVIPPYEETKLSRPKSSLSRMASKYFIDPIRRSALPTMSHRLFNIIKQEKYYQDDIRNAAAARREISRAFAEWGSRCVDNSVVAVTEGMRILFAQLSNADAIFAKDLDRYRAELKLIRDTESSISPIQKSSNASMQDIAKAKANPHFSAQKLRILEQEYERLQIQESMAWNQLFIVTHNGLRHALQLYFKSMADKAKRDSIIAEHGMRLADALTLIEDSDTGAAVSELCSRNTSDVISENIDDMVKHIVESLNNLLLSNDETDAQSCFDQYSTAGIRSVECDASIASDAYVDRSSPSQRQGTSGINLISISSPTASNVPTNVSVREHSAAMCDIENTYHMQSRITRSDANTDYSSKENIGVLEADRIKREWASSRFQAHEQNYI